MVKDGVLNRQGNLDLVGAKMDLAGMRPGNRALADGGAEAEGERGGGHFRF